MSITNESFNDFDILGGSKHSSDIAKLKGYTTLEMCLSKFEKQFKEKTQFGDYELRFIIVDKETGKTEIH